MAHIYTRQALRDCLLEEAIEIMQVDVTRVGGVTEWMQAADVAGCFNCPSVSHAADAGLVHQHLVAATWNAPMQEHVPFGEGIFTEPADIREGVRYLPETPGASTDFIPEQFDKFRVA